MKNYIKDALRLNTAVLSIKYNIEACKYDSTAFAELEAAVLRAEKAMEKQAWIPVSERLPSDSEFVHVTVKRGYVETGYYDEAREEWWKVDDDGLLDVIAWLPVPEPYQEN
ncbi:hypothetical protein [Lacrimispora sp.]|uniref:hypothetical protein n=1 Tax=Lacrimispora sp. TaxID=2719234 RepID=UPI0032E4714E